jgi:hypothetical protein
MIGNAGACFVEKKDGQTKIVQNCPDFQEREQGVVLGSIFS